MIKYIILSSFIFTIGLLGLTFVRRHIILILIFIELIFLSANLNFVVFSVFLDDISGQIFCLFLLVVAASEAAIGLSLLIAYYRLRGGISVNLLCLLKG
jgi:NADH-quinone oxidoreductase subunit K